MSKDLFLEFNNLYKRKHNTILEYLFLNFDNPYHSFKIFTEDQNKNNIIIQINFEDNPEKKLLNTSSIITHRRFESISTSKGQEEYLSLQDIHYILEKLKETIPKTENIKK